MTTLLGKFCQTGQAVLCWMHPLSPFFIFAKPHVFFVDSLIRDNGTVSFTVIIN